MNGGEAGLLELIKKQLGSGKEIKIGAGIISALLLGFYGGMIFEERIGGNTIPIQGADVGWQKAVNKDLESIRGTLIGLQVQATNQGEDIDEIKKEVKDANDRIITVMRDFQNYWRGGGRSSP
jgi:hypothetical protein